MKYYIFFHLINGHDVRMSTDVDLDLENFQDDIANRLTQNSFLHFLEGDNLVIVNISNVAYIKVTKAE